MAFEEVLEDCIDPDNAMPVPNDEFDPPPTVKKVEVFDDYIHEAPGEVVSPNTLMSGSYTGTVAEPDDQLINNRGGND